MRGIKNNNKKERAASPNAADVGRDFRDVDGLWWENNKSNRGNVISVSPFYVSSCNISSAASPPRQGLPTFFFTAASPVPAGTLLKALFTGASLSGGRRRSFTQTCTGRANNPLRVTAQALLLDGEKNSRFPRGVGKDVAVAAQQTIHAHNMSCRIGERQTK